MAITQGPVGGFPVVSDPLVADLDDEPELGPGSAGSSSNQKVVCDCRACHMLGRTRKVSKSTRSRHRRRFNVGGPISALAIDKEEVQSVVRKTKLPGKVVQQLMAQAQARAQLMESQGQSMAAETIGEAPDHRLEASTTFASQQFQQHPVQTPSLSSSNPSQHYSVFSSQQQMLRMRESHPKMYYTPAVARLAPEQQASPHPQPHLQPISQMPQMSPIPMSLQQPVLPVQASHQAQPMQESMMNFFHQEMPIDVPMLCELSSERPDEGDDNSSSEVSEDLESPQDCHSESSSDSATSPDSPNTVVRHRYGSSEDAVENVTIELFHSILQLLRAEFSV